MPCDIRQVSYFVIFILLETNKIYHSGKYLFKLQDNVGQLRVSRVDRNLTPRTYIACIPTSDTVQGTLSASDSDWGWGFPATAELLKGQDYFLHILANDDGGVARMLGQFTLAGTDHTFVNGTTSLLTNKVDFKGNNTGFNGVYSAWANTARGLRQTSAVAVKKSRH
jgi:hypothetical protein